MSSGQTGAAAAKSHTAFKHALEDAQRTMPFLANASDDQADPEFLLDLYTAVEEHGTVSAALSGFTLGILPCFFHSDVRVVAALRTADGQDLITHTASAEIRGIFEILLLPLLPWTLTHRLEDEKVFGEPMRNALDAVAQDFPHVDPRRT